jgi:ATP-dependent Clp protease ATP-binding subunit ClpB
LEDGRLTDNKGRVANFKNTIIIMTSNIGSDLIQSNFANMEGNEEEVIAKTEALVFEVLKKSVRPEFLNRIDEVTMFKPLSRSDIRKITEIQLDNLKKVLRKQDIELEIAAEAMDWLAQEGFNPEFGARPLKRVIQRKVMNELADALLLNKIAPGSKAVLDIFDGKVVFRKPISADINLN